MPFVHIASNYFLHFYNLFLIQFSLKNYEIFCMMITKMSTILWWILINFPLAGFFMVIIFLTCVHEWYIVTFELWNSHVASNELEIFCGETRHIDLHFHIKFVHFPFVVCELWFFEVMCWIWCHNMNMYVPNFCSHASSYPNHFKFCMNDPLYV